MKQFLKENSYRKAVFYCLQSRYVSVDILCQDLWWWAISKNSRVFNFAIFSIRENRENFMLAKYTWFTVLNKSINTALVGLWQTSVPCPLKSLFCNAVITKSIYHTRDLCQGNWKHQAGFNNNNNNTRSSIACLTYMSRHALQINLS